VTTIVTDPRRWRSIAFAVVVGIAVLAIVGVVVSSRTRWAYRQPLSADTLGPSEHSLLVLAVAAACAGLLLGLPKRHGLQLIVAAVVVIASGVVAFIAVAVVGLSQPCANETTCDIESVPAAVEAGFAVWVCVAAAMGVGFAVGFVIRRALIHRVG
jgi:hypothetical protein